MQIVAEEVWKRLDLTAEAGLNKSDYLEKRERGDCNDCNLIREFKKETMCSIAYFSSEIVPT
jgi:hypothetical protein